MADYRGTSAPGRTAGWTVGRKIAGLLAVPLTLLTLVTLFALFGLARMNAATEALYQGSSVPVAQLKQISDDYAVYVIDAVNKADAGLFTPEEALGGVTEARARIDETWRAYAAGDRTAEQDAVAGDVEALFAPVDTELDALRAAADDDPDAAFATFDGRLYDTVDPLTERVADLVALHLEQGEADHAGAGALYRRTRLLLALALLGCVAASALLGQRVIRALVAPLHELTGHAAHIQAGRLDLPDLPVRTGDEVGDLARGFNAMLATLRDLVGRIRANAEQAGVSAAAGEQVSASVATVATAVEQMNASVREIAQNAGEASRVAAGAVATADHATVTVSRLGDSSAEIGKVIEVITGIAEQTNLLALNATIEAARAGEAGKGFAVVAGEVKELAKETAKATEVIGKRIAAIQADTGGAVEGIGEVSRVIARIADIQTTIASAVEEQTATTAEIARSVNEAARGSAEIAENIAAVAHAAESLDDRA